MILHLSQFHTLSTNLDLTVLAPNIHQTVGRILDHVPSSVQSRISSGAELFHPGRVLKEALRGLLFVVEISTGDAGAFDEKFSDSADGREPMRIGLVGEPRIQHSRSTNDPSIHSWSDGRGHGGH